MHCYTWEEDRTTLFDRIQKEKREIEHCYIEAICLFQKSLMSYSLQNSMDHVREGKTIADHFF